ncbi:unnamed protein product [Parnassius apollo]|uniref:(apollo) hypothetical protein n=1 Tax=Parnassius apollo TaxID=110799 RepID=A0A8S3XJ71_PARAO|nr:unnamed protein product [Parnassius apollo]
MFKKLKDKLAEEVKSSPQRIQQFAQAAQAVVTSASSSITDITNNDLFSIGDNDGTNRSPESSNNSKRNTIHEVSPVQQGSLPLGSETPDTSFGHEETTRHRRLSNSSFASDISFRLPTYESPSMYHLQSDMDVSASEAEEKGFSGGAVNLDRVTKDQLFLAYKRTQDRCRKYKTQYADLARHYKLLERENAKARNVLVETQDKALRRISELREQCTLEQGAKAHLEKAMRDEIEEKNIKIDTLNTKLKLIQNNAKINNDLLDEVSKKNNESDGHSQLIDLAIEEKEENKNESITSEVTILNNKVSKMEELLNKYKESLKICKEKNAQIMGEQQILATDLENKQKEIDQLKAVNISLIDTKQTIDDLNNFIEDLQSKHTAFEFGKNKEISVLKLDLDQAHNEIMQLKNKIEVLSKREEEYAISLAENKLSIHKELENKEAEIKSLKDNLASSQNEIQSLNIVVSDYKKNYSLLEEERSRFNNNLNEYNLAKIKIKQLEQQLDDSTKKYQLLENSKIKLDEEYKCLQLQLKQETAEKLAMIDRNLYLENRNTQLSEESLKKSSQINKLESEIKLLYNNKESQNVSVLDNHSENPEIIAEVNNWKTKYEHLEFEIQEKREELLEKQKKIEKLLCDVESLENENLQLHTQLSDMDSRNNVVQEQYQQMKTLYDNILKKVKLLREDILLIKQETKLSIDEVSCDINETFKEELKTLISKVVNKSNEKCSQLKCNNELLKKQLNDVTSNLQLKIKEVDDLQIKLQQEITEHDKIKQTLENNLEQHNVLQQKMFDLKNENKNLNDSLQFDTIEKTTLAEKLKQKEEENTELFQKILDLESKIKLNVDSELNYIKISKETEELLDKLKICEKLKITTENELQILKLKIEECEQDRISLQRENTQLLENNKRMENANGELLIQINNLTKKMNDNEELSVQLRRENEKLLNDLKRTEKRNSESAVLYQNLIDKIKGIEIKTHEMKKEQSILEDKIILIQDAKAAIETDYKNLQNQIEQLKTKNTLLETENKELNSKIKIMTKECFENETILNELTKIKDSNVYLQEKVNIIKKQKEHDLINIEALQQENVDLKKKVDYHEENILRTQELEKELILLKKENETLKIQLETNLSNIKIFENEMKQIRDSHSEIEKEKDNLNSIIKKIENSQLNAKLSSTLDIAHTQTSNDNIAEESDEKIVPSKITTNSSVQTSNDELHFKIDPENLETSSISHDYTLLKEENRRLRSDIEGLQTYLAKISKDNSLLNDKLREVITSNDIFADQSEVSQYDIETLKNEIQSGKDKIDNLIRENTLLVEENLELKDQISFQSTYKPSLFEPTESNENIVNIKKMYDSAVDSKNYLEIRVKELEHMNLSINSNMQEMQVNNEKLKHSNEKLERSLDEALVSLRHLHSLQENTELEYLRNILYEYLTGSGTHSLTLAKVLSAVVKFNDSQTELVLQKERERQGILRQLGII